MAEARQVSCAVFAVRPDGRFLMQRRGRGCGTGDWSVPGGRVEPGEAPASAARREFLEETGLALQARLQSLADTYVDCTECPERWLTMWYYGHTEGEPRLCEEASEFRWVTWGELPQPLWWPHWHGLFTARGYPPFPGEVRDG